MPVDAAGLAAEVLACLDGARQVEPFTARLPDLSKADAYRVTAELRRLRSARGERPAGRKIGFTNRGIWAEYGVYEPIWGDMYDTTVADVAPGATFKVSHLSEPRIEPEIVFGTAEDLVPGLSIEELLERIDWVAHGFEIVQSIFPSWRFAVADCIAGGGLHGRLAVGPRIELDRSLRREMFAALPVLSIALSRNGEVVDRGVGANVLDGPPQALGHLVEVLAGDADNPPVKAGEMVTTGTLTRAFPVFAGERWSTEIDGLPLAGLDVTLA
ncbi:MAG: 2-keto-4-pentenoate hydratase [Rhizobiaceae bacterium]